MYIIYIVISFVKNFCSDSIVASWKLRSEIWDTTVSFRPLKTPILILNRETGRLLPNDRPFSSFGHRTRFLTVNGAWLKVHGSLGAKEKGRNIM